jgi:hypothetical protein
MRILLVLVCLSLLACGDQKPPMVPDNPDLTAQPDAGPATPPQPLPPG